jgi:hypothetical protein
MHARQDDVEDDHVEVATPLQGGHRAHRAVDDLGAEGDLVRVRVKARVRIRVRVRVRARARMREHLGLGEE